MGSSRLPPSPRLLFVLGCVAWLALLSPLEARARGKGKRHRKAVPTVQSRCGDLQRWDATVRELLGLLEVAPDRWPEGPAIDKLGRSLPGIVELGTIAEHDPAASEEVHVAGERLAKSVASLQEPLKRKYAPLVAPALRRLADSFEVIRPTCERLPGAAPSTPEEPAAPSP